MTGSVLVRTTVCAPVGSVVVTIRSPVLWSWRVSTTSKLVGSTPRVVVTTEPSLRVSTNVVVPLEVDSVTTVPSGLV